MNMTATVTGLRREISDLERQLKQVALSRSVWGNIPADATLTVKHTGTFGNEWIGYGRPSEVQPILDAIERAKEALKRRRAEIETWPSRIKAAAQEAAKKAEEERRCAAARHERYLAMKAIFDRYGVRVPTPYMLRVGKQKRTPCVESPNRRHGDPHIRLQHWLFEHGYSVADIKELFRLKGWRYTSPSPAPAVRSRSPRAAKQRQQSEKINWLKQGF